MMGLALLALAPLGAGGSVGSLPCVPRASDQSNATQSAIEEHRALREAIGEPMSQSSTMVMLYGRGGHLATQEHSIVLFRSRSGIWQGTAVGRTRIAVEGAPYQPMERAEWTLDRNAGRQLDDAIARRCPQSQPDVEGSSPSGPPPRGLIVERIDILRADLPISTFYASEEGGKIAALIRPPM
jgi:hypothetical protein